MFCLRKCKESGWRSGNWFIRHHFHTLVVADKFFGEIFFNNMQGLTPRVKKQSEKTFSVFRYIGHHSATEIFAVRWNVASEISKLLLNDIFAELDGNRQWDWEYYDWQIRSWWIASRTIYQYITKNYTSQVNQALSSCFFSVFSETLERWVSTIFRLSNMHACISSYWVLWVSPWRYTNADLKISLYFRVHIKMIPWKFCILTPKNTLVIGP